LTRFAVIVQPDAEAEIEAAFTYLATAASVERAVDWFNRLEAALSTLEGMPRRCPPAPENVFFEDEIRQLLLPPYRILFTIRKRSVHVLHVRHMARDKLEGFEGR
jgi:plasmid stabilization system protein ParE